MSMQEMDPFVAFEQILSQWLAGAVEPPSEPPPKQMDLPLLRLFEERLKHLQTYLDKAEQHAERGLAPLSTEIQAIQQWLNALSAARGKLVECTVRFAVT